MHPVCVQSTRRTLLTDTAGTVGEVPLEEKHSDVFSPFDGASIPACCPFLPAVEALVFIIESVLRLSFRLDYSLILWAKEAAQTDQESTPRLLGENPVNGCWWFTPPLYIYWLNLEPLLGPSGESPFTRFTPVPFLFHRVSSPICFLASRNS